MRLHDQLVNEHTEADASPEHEPQHTTDTEKVKHLLKRKADATSSLYPEFPDGLFYGNFGYLADAFLDGFVIDAPFVLAIGIAAVGIMSGRKRLIRAFDDAPETHFPNSYCLLVGPSKYAAKSTARKALIKLIENSNTDMNFDVNLLESIGSRQALLTDLKTDGYVNALDGVNSVLHFDEMKSMFDTMRRDYARDLQATLISLWECPKLMKNNAISNPIEAYYPVMSLFGCSTRDWLNAALVHDDLSGGFMNRFICFGTDGIPKRISKPKIDGVAYTKFIACLASLQETPINKSAKGYCLTSEAWDRYDGWCDALWEEGRKNPEASVGTARSEIHALKIALALHLATYPLEASIDIECMDTAIAIADYTAAIGTFLYQSVVSNENAKLEQKIFEVLNANDNSLPRKAIQFQLKHYGYKIVGDVLDNLMIEGFLYHNTENGNIEVKAIEK